MAGVAGVAAVAGLAGVAAVAAVAGLAGVAAVAAVAGLAGVAAVAVWLLAAEAANEASNKAVANGIEKDRRMEVSGISPDVEVGHCHCPPGYAVWRLH